MIGVVRSVLVVFAVWMGLTSPLVEGPAAWRTVGMWATHGVVWMMGE